MELRDIQYFSVVAEHRHLGRAAEALKLSTSALSKCLRRLEKALQVKLVTRTSKGVELTPEGTALHSHVQRLQVSLADVAREVSELRHGLAGRLRVGANAGVSDNLLTAASIALFRETSKVMYYVTIGNSDVLLPALRSGELDLIISGMPEVPYEDVVQEHLYDDEFVVCAAVNHRLAKRKHLKLADLAQECWTMTTPNNMQWQTFHRAFEARGLPPPKITMVSLATSIKLRTVAATHLLGFISRRLFEQSRTEIPLVELPLGEVLYRRSLAIGYRKNAYLSPTARRFMDLLKAAAKDVTAGKSLSR